MNRQQRLGRHSVALLSLIGILHPLAAGALAPDMKCDRLLVDELTTQNVSLVSQKVLSPFGRLPIVDVDVKKLERPLNVHAQLVPTVIVTILGPYLSPGQVDQPTLNLNCTPMGLSVTATFTARRYGCLDCIYHRPEISIRASILTSPVTITGQLVILDEQGQILDEAPGAWGTFPLYFFRTFDVEPDARSPSATPP